MVLETNHKVRVHTFKKQTGHAGFFILLRMSLRNDKSNEIINLAHFLKA